MGKFGDNKGTFIVLVVVISVVVQMIFATIKPDWYILGALGISPSMMLFGVLGGVLIILAILRKGQSKTRWRNDASDYLGNRLRRLARILPFVKKLQFRNATPEAELPFEFRNLMVELQILMNYMLRLEVYNVKGGFVGEAQKMTEEMDLKYKDIREAGKQKADVWEYKVGTRWVQNDNTTKMESKPFSIKSSERDGQVATRRVSTDGWANHRVLIFRVMNHFSETLSNINELKKEKITDEVQFKMNILNQSVGDLIGMADSFLTIREDKKDSAKMHMNYRKVEANIEFYGLAQNRDSHRWQVLDQNNVNGIYIHTYRFGRINNNKETRYDVWRVRVIENSLGTKLVVPVSKGGPGAIKPTGAYGLGTQLIEVDLRGFFVDDLNDILNKKYPANPNGEWDCRRVPIGDVIDHSSFADICSDITNEWTFFIKDVRTGTYHPFSRTASDYNICHQKRDFNYKNMLAHLATSRREPGYQYPAFDREALKDPSFVYRGKKMYFDKTENLMVLDPINVPTLSTRGMTDYIIGRVKEIEKLSNLDDAYMRAWKFDYESEPKTGEGS